MRQTWSTLMITWLTVFQGQSFLLPADSDAGKYAKPYRAHKLALPKTYITKRGETVCVCVCVRCAGMPSAHPARWWEYMKRTLTSFPDFLQYGTANDRKVGWVREQPLLTPFHPSPLSSFTVAPPSLLLSSSSLPPPLSTLQDKWFCSPHQTTWWLVAPVRYTSGRSPANRLPENWEPLIT